MSVSAINASGGAGKIIPAGSYRMSGLLRSEWTKMRTVRSTMWTLGVTIVLAIGISAIACIETRIHWTPGNAVGFDATSTSLIGVFIAQFTIGILGVLIMSAEYGTGTIRATLSAAPRRPRVLAAKTLVLGLVTLIVSESVAFIAYFLGQALLSAPAIHTTIGSPGALRAVVGCGLYVCLLGLFALGLATMIRHTAGAISAFIGVLLVLPIVIQALPSSIANKVQPFLPTHIGQSVLSLQRQPHTFAPWPSLLLLAGYAAASLVIGGILLVRRDA
jgi:ABC-type transport system involved in multi-copper enzyme maturation permease subunit